MFYFLTKMMNNTHFDTRMSMTGHCYKIKLTGNQTNNIKHLCNSDCQRGVEHDNL